MIINFISILELYNMRVIYYQDFMMILKLNELQQNKVQAYMYGLLN